MPVKTKWENVNFHLLLFDLDRLVELLHSPQLQGLRASNSFHSYEALKRAKSTAGKKALVLKRNRTSGSLAPLNGPKAPSAAEDQRPFRESKVVRPLEPGGSGGKGTKRPKKPKSSKKVRRQPSGRVNVNILTDAGKLLLSCLLPWGVDRELDDLCVQHLDILRLLYPASLGLVSQNSHLSLTLPGRGVAHPVDVGQQQEVTNLFSSQVLDLRTKYFAIAEEQVGNLNRNVRSPGATERALTLVYLLSRICLVQRIIRMPFKGTR